MAKRLSETKTMSNLWDLPPEVIFQAVSYVAGPTERAAVVCHQLAALCETAKSVFSEETSPLWSAILQEDYGVELTNARQTRSSKRLKQSHFQRVRDAHQMTRDNTEIAFYYLTEMCQSSSPNSLSRSKLCSLLHEYGPHLRINRLTSTGGIFLVEICRARHVKESTIRKCVEELVENYGANVNVVTSESNGSYSTPLCVASSRGMPSVVRYLLDKGASVESKSTARFRLYTVARRSIKCEDATALQFAEAMHNAELREGASDADVKDIKKVIRLLGINRTKQTS